MAIRNLTKNNLSSDEDWYGNNAAVTCAVCRQVFVVSGFINKGRRECPRCQKSTAEITDEQVKVEWPEELLGSTALLRGIEKTISPPWGQYPAGKLRVCIRDTSCISIQDRAAAVLSERTRSHHDSCGGPGH